MDMRRGPLGVLRASIFHARQGQARAGASISNYSIVRADPSSLLLEEKFANRVLLGLFLVGFGAVVCGLSTTGASGSAGAVGRLIAWAIGIASILIGSLSILRRGWIKIDQARSRIEFLGGFQKFRRSPRVVHFDDIAEISIRSSVGRHTSYAIDVVIDEASDIVLDQTSSPTDANELGEELARRIGCELRGRVP